MPTASLDETLDRAVADHDAGRLADAEPAYRRVLAAEPDHADALHLLGLLLHQTGRSAEAEPLVRRAIAVDPSQAAFHTHLGLIRSASGDAAGGIDSHRRATALDPASADAHNNLGVALAAAGRWAEAVDSYRRAIAIQPEAATLDNLSRALHAAGRGDEAADALARAVQLRPGVAEWQHRLGDWHRAAGRLLPAVAAYRAAAAVDPPSAAAYTDLGNACRAAGAVDGAIAAHRRAGELAPASPVPLDNLGSALQAAGRPDEARAVYDAALALHPGRPETLNHLGTLHCDAGRWADAIDCYTRALSARPDFVDAVNNLGTALEEVGRRDEAMAHYRRAAELSPAAVSPPWNVALLQLLTGDYAAGWPGYEHRWRQPLQRSVHRPFDRPLWDGSPLAGRRLLLHAEQGFGDAIQFARYAPLAAARGMSNGGGKVFVECHPPLAKLFRTLAGVDCVVARDQGPLPPFDVHCPFMSLPRLFGTTVATVPAAVPYLRPAAAAANRWRKRLAADPPGRRVGLVIAGDPKHQKDRDRSLPPSAVVPLADVPGVRFYSLQVGRPLAGVPATDWTADLHDFADTAALVSQLELVITADTAVAHLAGALGRPTWVLVPFAPDWRWLLDRDDSPWYPTARLFRQESVGDWADPVRRVAEALRTPTFQTL